LKQIKEKIKTKDQQILAIEEQKIKTKQAINNIKDNLESELENAEAVFKAVSDMVKKIKVKSLLTEDEYLKLAEYNAIDSFRVGMGAEAILELIKKVDLEKLIAKLRDEARNNTGQKRI